MENANTQNITEKFEQLLNEKKKLKNSLKQYGEQYITEKFKLLFEDNPILEKIKWTQYTPYFNDGDPCVFSISDPDVAMNPDPRLEEFFDIDDNGTYWLHVWDRDRFKETDPELNKLINRVLDLWDILYDIEETCQGIFGDHAEIIVTREGFKIEEYDHD